MDRDSDGLTVRSGPEPFDRRERIVTVTDGTGRPVVTMILHEGALDMLAAGRSLPCPAAVLGRPAWEAAGVGGRAVGARSVTVWLSVPEVTAERLDRWVSWLREDVEVLADAGFTTRWEGGTLEAVFTLRPARALPPQRLRKLAAHAEWAAVRHGLALRPPWARP